MTDHALTPETLAQPPSWMGWNRLLAERDAALAEVAALREQIGGLEPVRFRRSASDRRLLWVSLDDLRAALDVDTAGHDDSSERDGGR